MRESLEDSSTRKKTTDDKGGTRSSEQFLDSFCQSFYFPEKNIVKYKLWKGQSEAGGDVRGELGRGGRGFALFCSRAGDGAGLPLPPLSKSPAAELDLQPQRSFLDCLFSCSLDGGRSWLPLTEFNQHRDT